MQNFEYKRQLCLIKEANIRRIITIKEHKKHQAHPTKITDKLKIETLKEH